MVQQSKQNILDKKIVCGDDFLKVFQQMLNSDKTRIISFVNPFSYDRLLCTPHFIENIDVFFSDGKLLCMFHSFFNRNKIQRASFDYSSIAESFFSYVVDNNLKVGIIGATTKELDLAIVHLKNRHKGLEIVYARNGYFDNKGDITDTLGTLSNHGVQILLVGMGTPYQEELTVHLKSLETQKILAITCGGFLTQTSMRPDYYFPIIKLLGLRWLQRMVMHRHVRERVINDYPKFIFNYIKHKLFSR